jgi:allantoate deiminase
VEYHGRAGHAGTTPMALRHDALCGAAELVLAAEQCGVLATVGQCLVEPGASNVIPGKVILTLDVRDAHDAPRRAAVKHLQSEARAIARRRGLQLVWTPIQETAAVTCDDQLTQLMQAAVAKHQPTVLTLPSGAGHDAAALSAICPVAMLFVRCKGGLSHHPGESVKTGDVTQAIAVLIDFIQLLAQHHA